MLERWPEGRGACHQAWWPEFHPRLHVVEAQNWLPQVVLLLLCAPTPTGRREKCKKKLRCIYVSSIYVNVCFYICECMYLHHMHFWCPWRLENSIWPTRTKGKHNCEPPCKGWSSARAGGTLSCWAIFLKKIKIFNRETNIRYVYICRRAGSLKQQKCKKNKVDEQQARK